MTLAAHATLSRTPLYDLHAEAAARFVPFAGYEMPVQFKAGVLKEHLHTRSAAGLFDVSHMGQLTLRPRSGRIADTAHALERLVPVDVVGLAPHRQRYALFTNENGGILDDLMIAHLGDRLLLVVNASRKDADETHLRSMLANDCEIERMDGHALLALQGPEAEAVLAALAPDVAAMRFMDVRETRIHNIRCVVSRSGYTGEDGFEISIPAQQAEGIARSLLAHEAVLPIGLGARDSLRLEVGLCLYGSDLGTGTTPVEAALEWAIQKSRRRGGERAGGFPGEAVVLDQLERGAKRRRVGLKSGDRTPIRSGAPIFETGTSATAIGSVTSGGFGPSVQAPVAMGYVPTPFARPGTSLFVEVRGKRVPTQVAPLPFVATNYKRTN